MKKSDRPKGMFIGDEEIRERYPERADEIIADLDKNGRTQKGKATRPAEARYRPDVEARIKEMGL